MGVSEKALSDIFYSGTHALKGDPTLIQKIFFLVDNNYLGYEKVIISSKEDYYKLCDSAKRSIHFDEAAGGSVGHVALKLLSQEYLLNFGIKVNFEKQFYGYFPDVISTDDKTIIECGHTDNADKIFTYFTQGNINELIQIPYPTSEDKYIFGHKFVPHDNLVEFLSEEFKASKSTILKILNKKRK